MMRVPKELGVIADVVLAYRPPEKAKERKVSVAVAMAACLMITIQGANRANLTREKFLDLVGAMWIWKEIN